MERSVRVTEFLARAGADIPKTLSIREDGGEVGATHGVVMIRETVAPGVELAELARRSPTGLTPAVQKLYIETMFDLARRGKDLPDSIAPKPSVATTPTMSASGGYCLLRARLTMSKLAA